MIERTLQAGVPCQWVTADEAYGQVKYLRVGATAVALAERAYEVVGVDGSATAIEQTRHEAGERNVSVEFAVAGLAEVTGHDQHFATVLDSAVFHTVDPDRRPACLRSIHELPGGTYISTKGLGRVLACRTGPDRA